MIKIAHVQVLPKLSGAQTVSYEILSKLSSEKYEKYLICGSEDKVDTSFFNKFESIGVRVIIVESLKREIGLQDFKAFFELLSVFKNYRFDIVHTNSTKPGIVARIAAKISGCKNVIHTVHGISFHKNEKKIKKVLYFSLEYVASLFSNTIVLVNSYYKKYYRYIPFVKVKTIYNGIDFNAFVFNKVDSDIVNVLFFSRLDRPKNPLLLLKAISYIEENNLVYENIKYRVSVYGDGELKRACEDYVLSRNISNIVSFFGWSSDKSKVYSEADILCIPSEYEAFGLVFVEAGFFAIPSISTYVEGVPEVIKHAETGLLCESGNIEDLADAISLLINDEKLRIKLGRNAKKFTSEFSSKKMVEAYEKLYMR